jgi:putative hemolysin
MKTSHWYVGLTRELRALAEDIALGGALDVPRLVFLLDSAADAVDDLRVVVPAPAPAARSKERPAPAVAAAPAVAGCPKNGGKRHRYEDYAGVRRCEHCDQPDPRAAPKQATIPGAAP